MEVAFEAGDEVCGVTAVEVVAQKADFDMGVGDGDADFVLDGGDRLSSDGEAPKAPDLGGWSAGLGGGLVEALSEDVLEVFAGVNAFGVGSAVDGHGEAVAPRVGDPADHGLEITGSMLRVVGASGGGVVGPPESVLVVVVRSLEPGEPCDTGIHGGLLQHKRVAGGKRLDLSEGEGLVADVVDIAIGQVAASDLGDERGLPL
ncbi:MAG: hypothetical protein H6515_13830 [Microthrixaceae bacterium]|nr:hypothetical protein [Microthrixaceae bacterium]